jgi:anaerobic ribonucleoside-triphosphate reductase
MASVKNAKNKKAICHDCKKEIEKEGNEIKNGLMLVYESEREKITIFKCKECFEKSQELKNYQPCEVYSRIVGYLRPVQQWNLGKQKEFQERKEYKIKI